MNPHHFLRNGLWVLTRQLIVLLFSCLSCFAQIGSSSIGKASLGTTVPPVANNVALVSGTAGGSDSGGTQPASISYAFGGQTVANGNFLFIGVVVANSTDTFTVGHLTKTAGTATIGTVVLDANINPTASTAGVAVYRVPVTGNGTVTMTYTPAVSSFMLIGGAAFSGVNATPLGTANHNNGTTLVETTGSVTTSSPGVIFFCSSEDAVGDFTRVDSDTLVYNKNTASSSVVGNVQYKIQSSSPNTVTSTLSGISAPPWYVAYAQYVTQ